MNKQNSNSVINNTWEKDEESVILNFASVARAPANQIPNIIACMNSIPGVRIIYKRYSTKHLHIIEVLDNVEEGQVDAPEEVIQ
ncbi:MAG: hypothetical protein A4E32_00304 [Methanomassiliicoccales archaeon PtaU1.Bin124]|nr:MAG: hypothetical protein A4E32_00304 [Methanomassiliicoccales archaeon PtaU1.Bin124]